MSNVSAVRRGDDDATASLQQVRAVAQLFVESGLFPDVKSVAKAAVKIMAGRELGFGPFASMSGIHIIAGKAEPGANLLAALVQRSDRHSYRVLTLTDECAALEFLRDGNPITPPAVSTFTAADAKRAGTQNVGKFPRNMLFARALSNGVKWFCPEITTGVPVYAPGEITDCADEPDRTANGDISDGDGDRQTLQEALASRERVSPSQLDRIDLLLARLGIDSSRALRGLVAYGVAEWRDLTPAQADAIETKLAVRAGAGVASTS